MGQLPVRALGACQPPDRLLRVHLEDRGEHLWTGGAAGRYCVPGGGPPGGGGNRFAARGRRKRPQMPRFGALPVWRDGVQSGVSGLVQRSGAECIQPLLMRSVYRAQLLF